jgi:hypothetical protein
VTLNAEALRMTQEADSDMASLLPALVKRRLNSSTSFVCWSQFLHASKVTISPVNFAALELYMDNYQHNNFSNLPFAFVYFFCNKVATVTLLTMATNK